MYLNPRPVFTGMTNKFDQQKRFRSLSFCHLKDPKDYYAFKKYIEFTESSTVVTIVI